jgi:putative addiction module CopG family antidote
MERSTLTISLPRSMKQFIEAKLQEGRFSTPSEYIRSLIRDDQDLGGARGEIAALLRNSSKGNVSRSEKKRRLPGGKTP